MTRHSYAIARRYGLTASQHLALRAIGGYGDPLVADRTSDKDVAKVTLEALVRKGYIVRRGEPEHVLPRVRLGDTWRAFELSSTGRAMATTLGVWAP